MSDILRRNLLVLLISLLIPSVAEAQPPGRTSEPPPSGQFLRLQQAIELALEKHPLLQEAAATLKAANARTEQARSIYYPHVDANSTPR